MFYFNFSKDEILKLICNFKYFIHIILIHIFKQATGDNQNLAGKYYFCYSYIQININVKIYIF